MVWKGRVRELALTNYQRASYLKHELAKISGISLTGNATTFNEFVINFGQPISDVLSYFRQHGIEPGLPLKGYYPELSQGFLVAVTETKSQGQLDRYIQLAGTITS